jgi:DNA-binding Lrp family transcriptional regulator
MSPEQSETVDYDRVLSKYYGEEQVTVIITIKVDTKEADSVANEISEHANIEDVFLVTGDTDIVAKARFASYRELKDFVVRFLSNLNGVKDTKTLMVVTAYKEKGLKKEYE